MYQRPKSSDCLVISVGRSGISVSAIQQIPSPKSQDPNPKSLQCVGTWGLGFGIWDFKKHINDVVLPFYVVAIRKIRPKVPAAAFLAAKRRARDHQPDRDDAAHSPEVVVGTGGRSHEDGRAPAFEMRHCLLQARAAPEQPAAAPHQIPRIIDGRHIAVRLTVSCAMPSDDW